MRDRTLAGPVHFCAAFKAAAHSRFSGTLCLRYSYYTGGISKCGDGRLRTLLYEAANVMLTRYSGSLALKNWALDIARRSTMRKVRVALARKLAVIMFAMLKYNTEFEPA